MTPCMNGEEKISKRTIQKAEYIIQHIKFPASFHHQLRPLPCDWHGCVLQTRKRVLFPNYKNKEQHNKKSCPQCDRLPRCHMCQLFASQIPRFPDSQIVTCASFLLPRFPDSQIPTFPRCHMCQLFASQIYRFPGSYILPLFSFSSCQRFSPNWGRAGIILLRSKQI